MHLALVANGQGVLEKIFENNGQIHVYSPGTGTDNRLMSKLFHN